MQAQNHTAPELTDKRPTELTHLTDALSTLQEDLQCIEERLQAFNDRLLGHVATTPTLKEEKESIPEGIFGLVDAELSNVGREVSRIETQLLRLERIG